MTPEHVPALHCLAHDEDMLGKGFLGLALIITDRAQRIGLPIDPASLMTPGGGQVAGAGGGMVKKLLEQQGIFRRLSSEGGRVDVLDYEQFLAANILEIGGFDAIGRRTAITAILDRYNEIVDRTEHDPSLRIMLS